MTAYRICPKGTIGTAQVYYGDFQVNAFLEWLPDERAKADPGDGLWVVDDFCPIHPDADGFSPVAIGEWVILHPDGKVEIVPDGDFFAQYEIVDD